MMEENESGDHKTPESVSGGKFFSQKVTADVKQKTDAQLRYDGMLGRASSKSKLRSQRLQYCIKTSNCGCKSTVAAGEPKTNSKKYYNKWFMPVKYWGIQKSEDYQLRPFTKDPLYLYEDIDHINRIYNYNPFPDLDVTGSMEKRLLDTHNRNVTKIQQCTLSV